jgi:hypothetical protein
MPMIVGLFWLCIKSLLKLLHTSGLPMKGFPGVSTIQLPVDLIPDAIRAKVVADVERAGEEEEKEVGVDEEGAGAA